MGITRDTVIKLAKNELDMDVVERPVDRSELYVAREAFMTGTAANITAVTEIDHRKVGDGEVGEITRKLQNLYSSVIRGRNPKYMEWCTPVYKR
jgi:branched-chain amino acid aminotransferase